MTEQLSPPMNLKSYNFVVHLWNSSDVSGRVVIINIWLSNRMLYLQSTLDKIACIKLDKDISPDDLTDEMVNSLC